MEWRNLSDPVFECAVARPEAIALIQQDTRISFGRLADLVGKASVDLHDLGIEPGETVAFAVPDGLDHVLLILALLRLGAIPLELPPRAVSDRFVAQLPRLGVARIILAPEAPALQALGCHRLPAGWRADLDRKSGDRRVARDPDEAHLLYLMTMANGMPAAIATTQRQWNARIGELQRVVPQVLTAAQPPVLVLPGTAGHTAWLFLITQLCLGGPVVLPGPRRGAEQVASAVAAAGDAVVLLSPELCRAFLVRPAASGGLFPQVRGLFVGATALSPREKLAAVERLTAQVYAIHAHPAVGVEAVLAPADLRSAAGSVGQVNPALELQILDGADQKQPSGTVGRVRLRGPGVARTLLGGTDALVAAMGFRDGWYCPNEVGRVDAAGRLHLLGRASQMVRRRGADVFLPEIEQVLRAHPAVADAACVGIAGRTGGEPRIIAFVVIRADEHPTQVLAACGNRFAAERAPDQVHVVGVLPRTGKGTPDFRQLLSSIARQPARPAPPADPTDADPAGS